MLENVGQIFRPHALGAIRRQELCLRRISLVSHDHWQTRGSVTSAPCAPATDLTVKRVSSGCMMYIQGLK